MKKIVSISMAIAFVAAMSSCTKSYTCICENTSTGSVTSSTTIKSSSSVSAELQCSGKSSSGVTCGI